MGGKFVIVYVGCVWFEVITEICFQIQVKQLVSVIFQIVMQEKQGYIAFLAFQFS